MVKQFTLSLDANQQKPVIKLDSMNALLDTGADFPVWAEDKELLVKKMNAKLIKKNVSFRGFGGDEGGDLYQIDCFVLGQLTYNGLYIVACDKYRSTEFYMILSATMFRNLIYEIDAKHHKLNINIPNDENPVRNLIVNDSNGKLYILYAGSQRDTYLSVLEVEQLTELQSI